LRLAPEAAPEFSAKARLVEEIPAEAMKVR
jgi:hypothetical protein